MTIADIITRAGGPDAISEATREMGEGWHRTHWAVRKWTTNGIPRGYMSLVARMAGITIAELHTVNEGLCRPLDVRSRTRRRAEHRPAA